MRRVARALVSAVFATGLATGLACGGSGTRVTRVVDGRVVVGRFVEPDAYALFLRGAIAEANGALDDAIRAYTAVSHLDEADPEIFARIARVRCTRDARDPDARLALGRAFALDGDYGPAWDAAARCGLGANARAHAARAEPRDVSLQVAFARSLERGSARATEARGLLLALTLEEPRSGEALSALASWADAHDDLDLLVLALGETPARAPRLDAAVARAALALAGEGQLAFARRVAGRLLDARTRRDRGGAPLDETTRAAIGRLAVDEAAEHDDQAAVERRAIGAHMTSTEAAARVALQGRFELARHLAEAVLAADPSDIGARMVLASVPSPRGARTAFDVGTPKAQMAAPAVACALFGRALWLTTGAANARAFLHAIACEPVARDDASALTLFVDLAARDVVDEAVLPAEGRIELAWRKREAPPGVDILPRSGSPSGARSGGLDARHELLGLAQSDPLSTRTAELAGRLARRGSTDPIVLAALVAVARARGETLDEVAHAALGPPANAVLDAALLEALPRGAPESVRVRVRFAGLAATPAERALVR